MVELGRDTEKLLKRGVEALEKNADASAKLIELATEERAIEYEPGPPHCPHCGAFNPSIIQNMDGEERKGALAQFVLVAMCESCDKVLFGIPQGWQMARTLEEARDLRDEKAGDNGHTP